MTGTPPAPTVAATPSASDWLALLTLVACPTPRPTEPACLDASASGESPARTAAVKVGGDVGISFTVDNAGPGVSPPITLLLFTWEPPLLPEFIRAVACDGCTIHAADVASALEWPGVTPGDHRLTATLRAVGHPTDGPVPSSQKAGEDYEWLAGFFALPTVAVLGQPEGIDSSRAFVLGTGETTITAR
ncbi:MAG TPA: hypothetical protein VJ506_08965 [Candidatus Limnocylindrales bacterium]|nr:hypothetical protein [Candidatus Limnocylindrales bacterium]